VSRGERAKAPTKAPTKAAPTRRFRPGQPPATCAPQRGSEGSAGAINALRPAGWRGRRQQGSSAASPGSGPKTRPLKEWTPDRAQHPFAASALCLPLVAARRESGAARFLVTAAGGTFFYIRRHRARWPHGCADLTSDRQQPSSRLQTRKTDRCSKCAVPTRGSATHLMPRTGQQALALFLGFSSPGPAS
jgi:hypothetical protein